MTPRVSVVTPAYNCAGTIAEAIASVQAQTVADWELLVVDDASTDGTAATVAALAEGDARVRLLRCGHNGGPAAARNLGVEAAVGEYIAFLDADDVWLPPKLERQLALMGEGDCALCYTAYAFMGPDGEDLHRTYAVPPKADYRTLLRENVVGLSTALVRRQALGALRFDAGYFHEDYQLWLRLLRDGAAACGVAQPLVRYRTGGRNAQKGRAARHRWAVYRRSEGLALPAAAYYMARYALAGLRKYF